MSDRLRPRPEHVTPVVRPGGRPMPPPPPIYDSDIAIEGDPEGSAIVKLATMPRRLEALEGEVSKLSDTLEQHRRVINALHRRTAPAAGDVLDELRRHGQLLEQILHLLKVGKVGR